LPAKIVLEYLASLSRERLLALVRELQQQMTLLQRQVTEVAATNDALRAEIDQLKRGSKR
jgi:cell division protein FtsB